MANSTKYWKGLEQLDNDASFVEANKNEFATELPVTDFLQDEETLSEGTTSRRDFLKYLGFGVAAASLAACETPVTKAIPYLNKPEEVTPGVANFYASTFSDGHDYCPVLVKTREGRPIFVKGNTASTLTGGEINARVNASVLSLYDNNRLKTPMIGGKAASWSSVDKTLAKALGSAKNIKVLSSTIISASTHQVIAEFLAKHGNSEMLMLEDENGNPVPLSSSSSEMNHIQYDAISYSGILDANKDSFGKRVIPTYNFANAKTIVSIGADFVSGWLDAMQYSKGYTSRRNPEGDWMSKHYQFEANMSLTGTNADVRTPVKPSHYGAVVANLYNEVASSVGGSKIKAGKLDKVAAARVKSAAKNLLDNKGESLVVCGSNDKNVQILVNGLNNMLGNYGKTIDVNKASNSKKGSDSKVAALIKEMESGKVDALLIYGVDPVFTLGDKFKKALGKVKTTVSFATKMDDTAASCKYVCPDNHWLESWNDANPVDGHYSLAQPTISPLFDTRQAQESFLKWSGNDSSFHDFIKTNWENNIFPNSGELMFADFWNKSLHDGIAEIKNSKSLEVGEAEAVPSNNFAADINAAASEVAKIKSAGTELLLYTKEGIGSGNGSDNPILQELPDPVSKITWDNYVTMNPTEMKDAGYNTVLGQENPANVLMVSVNGVSLELPVIAQPGQAKGTIGIALGYGKKVGKMEEPTGKNAYPFVGVDKKGNVSYSVSAKVTAAEGVYPIAATQTHQTVMGRDSIIRETTLDIYKKGNKEDYNPAFTLLSGETDEHGHQIAKPIKEFDLWGDHPVKDIGHRWGMSIDMNLCTGCGACITACNLENNVPVVGKDEVRRGREMHWLRIDRYYSSEHEPLAAIGDTHDSTMEATEKGSIGAYSEMESPADNPRVVHQPMMCQHCNHAGCETVCPVAATTHSNEGLNMMAYNRCIGTRYCANNCAYKVRRFNWFNYMAYSKFTDINPSQDDLGRMVLNPDVVVRARGVMEKCSMCVQNIQAGKLEAKKAGTPVMDGAIQTACSSACGAGAIKFGDLNDKESEVRAGMDNDRAYRVIEEVGQDTNVYYQTKVRNVKQNEA